MSLSLSSPAPSQPISTPITLASDQSTDKQAPTTTVVATPLARTRATGPKRPQVMTLTSRIVPPHAPEAAKAVIKRFVERWAALATASLVREARARSGEQVVLSAVPVVV